MGFSRQEYWSGLPRPPPGDLPAPGIEPRSPALRVDSLPTEPLVTLAALFSIKCQEGTSLVVQWLRLVLTMEGAWVQTLDRGTKNPHALVHGQKNFSS